MLRLIRVHLDGQYFTIREDFMYYAEIAEYIEENEPPLSLGERYIIEVSN